MIIFILMIIISLICIPLEIKYWKINKDKAWFRNTESDWLHYIAIISWTVIGFAFTMCSIIAIITHSTLMKDTKRIELTERINSINNTRKALEQRIETSTYTVLEINNYNETVKSFKVDLQKEQKALNNPWINWMYCPVYNEFSADQVSYLFA